MIIKVRYLPPIVIYQNWWLKKTLKKMMIGLQMQETSPQVKIPLNKILMELMINKIKIKTRLDPIFNIARLSRMERSCISAYLKGVGKLYHALEISKGIARFIQASKIISADIVVSGIIRGQTWRDTVPYSAIKTQWLGINYWTKAEQKQ